MSGEESDLSDWGSHLETEIPDDGFEFWYHPLEEGRENGLGDGESRRNTLIFYHEGTDSYYLVDQTDLNDANSKSGDLDPLVWIIERSEELSGNLESEYCSVFDIDDELVIYEPGNEERWIEGPPEYAEER